MGTFVKSRAGSVRLGTMLMILCFVGIGGFMYWLSVTAEPTEVVVVEPEEAVLNAVPFEDFSAGTATYIGQAITLQGITVTSLLGPHAFWTGLADAQSTPYLLHFSEMLVADSTSVTQGGTVDVTGMVTAMSDSVLDAWQAAGAFPQEIDRTLAEFSENFVEVTSIEGATASATESEEPSS